GLRLPDQRLAAAGQDASDRTERAARRFVRHPLHRDLLLPLVPTARSGRASGPRESNRSHVTSARIAVEPARARDVVRKPLQNAVTLRAMRCNAYVAMR